MKLNLISKMFALGLALMSGIGFSQGYVDSQKTDRGTRSQKLSAEQRIEKNKKHFDVLLADLGLLTGSLGLGVAAESVEAKKKRAAPEKLSVKSAAYFYKIEELDYLESFNEYEKLAKKGASKMALEAQRVRIADIVKDLHPNNPMTKAYLEIMATGAMSADLSGMLKIRRMALNAEATEMLTKELGSMRGVKALKGVALIGTTYFIIDASKQIIAISKDDPNPRVVADVGDDLSKKSSEEIGNYLLKKFQDSHSGTSISLEKNNNTETIDESKTRTKQH